jgi:hypothetical protein
MRLPPGDASQGTQKNSGRAPETCPLVRRSELKVVDHVLELRSLTLADDPHRVGIVGVAEYCENAQPRSGTFASALVRVGTRASWA